MKLKRELDHNSFKLHYQSIFNRRSNLMTLNFEHKNLTDMEKEL